MPHPRLQPAVLSALLFALSLVPGQSPRAADPDPSGETKTQVLIVYHSRRGTTQQMAEAVAEGAAKVPDTKVTIRRVEEVTKQELQAADGLILGSPTYFANIAGTMKTAMDDWNWKLRVDFTNKVGGAFATGGGQTGGKEHVVVSLLLFMLNNRMVVAGPLYQDETGEDIWGEIGSTAMTGPLDPGVGDADREGARRLGQRVAEVAKRMRRTD